MEIFYHLRLFVQLNVWIAWCTTLSQYYSTSAFVLPASQFPYQRVVSNRQLLHTITNRNNRICEEKVCLHSSRGDGNNDDYGMIDRHSAFVHNSKRTSILHFLTQRSIQSFIFLASECRDPHTGDWIERTTNTSNLLEYHGTGAFNLTRFPEWDTILLEMMDMPKNKIIIQAKRRGAGHGGWSKNNPYLKARFVEFEIDVDPLSLVPRILSVQEQIAEEWVKDLKTLANANDLILESYHNNAVEARKVEEDNRKSDTYDDENVPSDYHQPSASDDKERTAFKSVSMIFILDKHYSFEDKKPSPLRKGSFDLLAMLALQESIHRVLRKYKTQGGEKALSFQWLRDIYVDKLDEHFDGNGSYGRSDDFLEEVLLTTPSIMKYEYEDNKNGIIRGLIDPLAIATDLIHMRTEVALEWADMVKHIPDYHIPIRQSFLEKQMSQWGENKSENVVESSSSDDSTNDNQLEINNEFQ